jgi:hypothetical protein
MQKSSPSPQVFAYVIATVGPSYRLNGCVPWVTDGKVFFGPCKSRMRPAARPGDYILGISRCGIGTPRRVLLWMRVMEKMTFAQACWRGEKNGTFKAARGHAIHVRPKEGAEYKPGDLKSYEHISRAPHPHKWRKDIVGRKDVFLVGGKGSWVAEGDGLIVTEHLAELLRKGIDWSGEATVRNPLTQNTRGKHALVTGTAARAILSLIPPVMRTIRSSGLRTVCVRDCPCE